MPRSRRGSDGWVMMALRGCAAAPARRAEHALSVSCLPPTRPSSWHSGTTVGCLFPLSVPRPPGANDMTTRLRERSPRDDPRYHVWQQGWLSRMPRVRVCVCSGGDWAMVRRRKARCVGAAMTRLVAQCVGIGLRLRSDSHGGGADGRDNLARGRADSVFEPGDCASCPACSCPAESAGASEPRSVVAGAPSRVHVRALRRLYRSSLQPSVARGRTDQLCGGKGCDSDATTTSGARVSIVSGTVPRGAIHGSWTARGASICWSAVRALRRRSWAQLTM